MQLGQYVIATHYSSFTYFATAEMTVSVPILQCSKRWFTDVQAPGFLTRLDGIEVVIISVAITSLSGTHEDYYVGISSRSTNRRKNSWSLQFTTSLLRWKVSTAVFCELQVERERHLTMSITSESVSLSAHVIVLF